MAIPGNFLSQVTESVDPNASGWTPLLNATISLGSGGRNGDGVLLVKSVAAGETRARTVTAYPVTAGTLYQAFADASGATVPERIGIRWLTAANTEISITWSLTTTAASATWHRIGVAGAAPLGAVRAHVILSGMTPAAAAVINYFENVYLGPPIRTTGNLLDFNTETNEVDASGWTPGANTTVTRSAPMVQWAVDFYHGGGQMLALTATAAGDASATTAAVAASPGVEYVFFGHINPTGASSNTWWELRFYDAANVLLQATRTILGSPGNGYYRQVGSTVAPPGTVTAVLAAGITGATAGQVTRFDNAVIAALSQTTDGQTIPAMPSGSVVPYADASFEQGVGTWTRTSGVATLARSTPWGAHAAHNNYALTVTSGTATTSVLTSARYPLGPDAESKSWASVTYVNVGTGSWTVIPSFLWYDASGTLLPTDDPGAVAIPATGWWAVTSDGVIPAGATQCALKLVLAAGAAASTLYVDRISLRPAVPVTERRVNADTASITVTARQLVTGQKITLWRVAADGTRTLVRGPNGLIENEPIVSDTLIVEDYEAPLATRVTYYRETRSTAGVLTAFSVWAAATIPHPDANLGWLKDPGNPQRNCKIMIMGDPPSWERPVDQAAYTVKGRRNKVVRSSVRNGNEGTLTISTPADETRLALSWLLDAGNVLLLQTAPGTGVGDLYCQVGQSTESRAGQDADDTWRTWTLPLVEQDRPTTVGVNGSAGRTWQDILSEFATWQDVLDTFATWEDVFLDRRKG